MTSHLPLFDRPRRSRLESRPGTVRRCGEDYPATLLSLGGRDVGHVRRSADEVWHWLSTYFHAAGSAATESEAVAAVEAHLVTCLGPALSWAPPPRRAP
jgi:hypothetical protein